MSDLFFEQNKKQRRKEDEIYGTYRYILKANLLFLLLVINFYKNTFFRYLVKLIQL